MIAYNIIPNKSYSHYIDCGMNNQTHYQSGAKRTTVSLDANVYHRLKSRGEFGETFSEIIGRILDQLDARNRGSKK